MIEEQRIKDEGFKSFTASDVLAIHDGRYGYEEGFKSGAEWAIKELEPKWIDVKEKLPPFGKYVNVWCRIYGRYITTCNDTEGGSQWKDFQGQFGGLPPLYWAEIKLPKPPKQD